MSDITVFFTLIISIIVFVVIDYYITVIKPYKKAVSNLKVGDKYIFTTEEDDPFIEAEILECTIKEIRYDKKGNPYVKYEYTDGSGDTMRFNRFILYFIKIK